LITVTVNIQSVLEDYVKGREEELKNYALQEGSTINDLIKSLQIPPGEIDMLVLNDRLWFDRNYVLQQGDKIDMFPSINGG